MLQRSACLDQVGEDERHRAALPRKAVHQHTALPPPLQRDRLRLKAPYTLKTRLIQIQVAVQIMPSTHNTHTGHAVSLVQGKWLVEWHSSPGCYQ